jgi:long-chain fatty acid transport protein
MYDSEFSLEGDGSGIGYNIGVMIHTDENTQIGVSYRGATDIEYEGTAKFSHQQQNITDLFTGAFMAQGADAATAAAMAAGAYQQNIAGAMPASQDGTATLSLPWQLNFGILRQLNPQWDVSAEVNVVGWEVYEDLTIDFDDDLPADKITQEKNWENSYVLRTGTSYMVNDRFTARGGLMYDFNPVPDETFDGQLPDSNRYAVSLGAGYKMGSFRLDASYMILDFLKRSKMNGMGYSVDETGNGGIVDRFDVDAVSAAIGRPYPVANGKYRGHAHLFSLSLSYNF